MDNTDTRKIVIVGCGFVGSSCAFTLMQSGLFNEMVLIDADKNKAQGEALDISHGLPFSKPMQIYAGSYDDIVDASIIIITAGTGQKPGETRLDLVHKNVEIFKKIIPEITKRNYQGIILVVSNPVDILTYTALKLSGLPSNQVLGSGTVLDSARLKYLIGEHLEVDPRSVHAFILGEHGDSEIAAFSSANVSGIPVKDFCKKVCHGDGSDEKLKTISDEVKQSAYEIIDKKGATYYGIAMSVKRICESIVLDQKSILPVSSLQKCDNELNGIVMSMPSIIGQHGVERRVDISLSDEEKHLLIQSASTLKFVIDEIDFEIK